MIQHNATDQDAEAPELSQAQFQALSALGSGSTITDSARVAGVDRTTIHRWLREDVHFQAAWNRLRAETRSEVAVRLNHLAGTALDSVQGSLEAGDARAELHRMEDARSDVPIAF